MSDTTIALEAERDFYARQTADLRGQIAMLKEAAQRRSPRQSQEFLRMEKRARLLQAEVKKLQQRCQNYSDSKRRLEAKLSVLLGANEPMATKALRYEAILTRTRTLILTLTWHPGRGQAAPGE